MTRIEGLDENLNPLLTDWIPVQSPGQKVKKVKLGNLPIQADTSALEDEVNTLSSSLNDLQNTKVDASALANTVSALQLSIDSKLSVDKAQRVFRSVATPAQPNHNDIWEQIDTNGNLLTGWYWDSFNNDWRSTTRSWSWNIFDTNRAALAWLPLAKEYSYYFTEARYFYRFNGGNSTNDKNYWTFRLSTSNDGSFNVDEWHGNILTNKPSNSFDRFRIKLCKYVNINNSNVISINWGIARHTDGSFAPPSLLTGIIIDYQLIYKPS